MDLKLHTTAFYLGNKVGGIVNMPFDIHDGYHPHPAKNKEETQELYNLFDLYLKSPKVLNFPYLFAFTANKFQTNSAGILLKNGFREVVEFYSSHGPHETLTLFTKTQEDSFDNFNDKDLVIHRAGLNCTIATNRDFYYVCNITSQNPGESFEDMKNLGYTRVKDTPIWFKICKENIIKKKV